MDQNDIHVAEVLVARNPDDGNFYRAKVINIDQNNEENVFTVNFIDFGNTVKCNVREMRKFRNESFTTQTTLPARCFPCRLAEIQPSVIHTTNNAWSQEANELFAKKISSHPGVRIEVGI